MIPAANHPMWGRLIRGEIEYKFRNATTGLMLTNLRYDYQRAPHEIGKQIERARQYFAKFEAVLAADIKQLFI